MPGASSAVFETGWSRAGCAICYDLRFPELFRSSGESGAVVMFVPAAFPNPRLEHWRTLLRARAIENQCFVVAVNQCGHEGPEPSEISYFGHSMVVDPWGRVLQECGESAERAVVEIDLGEIDRVRGAIPALQDRRPDAYRRPAVDGLDSSVDG